MSKNPVLGSRALFGALEPAVYLAHAAISPASDPVRAAACRVADRMAERGADAFAEMLEMREVLRAKLARLIRAEPEDIGFVLDTTHGLSALATSIPFKPGDRIVLFRGEYPSNVSVFQQLARRLGLSTVFLDAWAFLQDVDEACAALARELERGARVVSVSQVQFQSGLRMPLSRIGGLCRQYGTWLCIDGVQGLGVVPLDVRRESVDMLACGAHKWLMGLPGAGFVYVRPEIMRLLQPVLVGNMSHVGGAEMLLGAPGQLRYDRPLLERPSVFEGGMLGAAALAALSASVELILEVGVGAILDHVRAYHDGLEPELIARGFSSVRAADPQLQSGILSLRPPAGIHAGQLAGALAGRGVQCSSPDGHLRLAPHWPNVLSEIPAVCAAVDAALDELR